MLLKLIRNTLLSRIKNRDCTLRSLYVSRKAQLGKQVKVARNVEIRAAVSLGDYSFVNVNSLILSGKIGRYCSIGCNCVIGPHEHPLNEFTTSNAIYKDRRFRKAIPIDELARPPVIGNDVWIGANVTVLQGVKIGDGAVIAAGAVVTRDVEERCVYAGVPAKKLKVRVDERGLADKLGKYWWKQDKSSVIDAVLKAL